MDKKDMKPNTLELERQAVIDTLGYMAPGTDEYEAVLKNLETIDRIQNADKNRRLILDPNTIFSGLISLAGIYMILHYEELRVLSTKALGFVVKPRL